MSSFEISSLDQSTYVHMTWQFAGNRFGYFTLEEINDAVWRLVAYGLILKRRNCAHASNACAQSSRNNLLALFVPEGTWSGIIWLCVEGKC